MKLIIVEACRIAGETVSEHADIGDVVDVASKEEASYLVRSGRALYSSKGDDPSKGLHTAQDDDVRRLKALGKQAREAQAQAAQPRGADTIGIAAAVSAAVGEVLKTLGIKPATAESATKV